MNTLIPDADPWAPTTILTLSTCTHRVQVQEKISPDDLGSVFILTDNDVIVTRYALLSVAVDAASKRCLAYLENREP